MVLFVELFPFGVYSLASACLPETSLVVGGRIDSVVPFVVVAVWVGLMGAKAASRFPTACFLCCASISTQELPSEAGVSFE